MLEDVEGWRLLRTLLRIRPATVTQATAIRGLPIGQLDAVIDRSDGLIRREGEQLHYMSPEALLADKTRTLAALAERLSELNAEYTRGAPEVALTVEVVHGSEEQWKAWGRYAATYPPRHPFTAYVSMDGLRDVVIPEIEAATAPYQRASYRQLLPAGSILTDADREVVATLQRTGAQVRVAPKVPSWFYSDPGVLWAVPVVWGEYPQTSIMIGTDPAIGAVVEAYAETLWSSAEPWQRPSNDWEDVLGLLGKGLSDSAVATALGISTRTLERRVADAMAHFQVGSRFELGAAWSRWSGRAGR